MGSPRAKLLPVGRVTLTEWTVGKTVIMGVGVSHPYGWNLSVGVGESRLGYTIEAVIKSTWVRIHSPSMSMMRREGTLPTGGLPLPGSQGV